MLLCKAEHADKVDRSVFPGLQGGPHMHTVTAIASLWRKRITPEFVAYAKQIVANAKKAFRKLMNALQALIRRTDNHLILIDLRNKGIPARNSPRHWTERARNKL